MRSVNQCCVSLYLMRYKNVQPIFQYFNSWMNFAEQMTKIKWSFRSMCSIMYYIPLWKKFFFGLFVLLKCFWYVFGMLSVCVWYAFGMFLVCVWYVFGMWGSWGNRARTNRRRPRRHRRCRRRSRRRRRLACVAEPDICSPFGGGGWAKRRVVCWFAWLFFRFFFSWPF